MNWQKLQAWRDVLTPSERAYLERRKRELLKSFGIPRKTEKLRGIKVEAITPWNNRAW